LNATRRPSALETCRQVESLKGRYQGLLLAISCTLAALGRHPEAVQVFEKGMQAPRA